MYVLYIIVCPFVLFLLAIVLSVLRYTDSDYPFGILWPLCCLFFDIRILITSLWYLQTLLMNSNISAILYVFPPEGYLTIISCMQNATPLARKGQLTLYSSS